jgi:peptidyl-tRNA hydrolase
MQNPEIIVRKDIGMPTGKICVQVSHALMKMILNLITTNNNGGMVIQSKEYKHLLNWVDKGKPFNVIYGECDSEITKKVSNLNNNRFFNIIDQGRTVFNGLPTWTVTMIVPEELSAAPNAIIHKDDYGKLKTKQTILITTRPRRPALTMVKECANMSIMTLLDKIKPQSDGTALFAIEDNSPLSAWLSGSFGKVVLGTRKKRKP